MKKIAAVLILILFAAGAAAGLVFANREAIFRDRVQKCLYRLTGAEAVISGLKVSRSPGVFGRCLLEIPEIRLKNFAGYVRPDLALVQNVRLDVNGLAFLTGRWDIRELQATLAEVYLEKNQTGEINLAQMPALQAAGMDQPAGKDRFHVGRMTLAYGVLSYWDSPAVEKAEIFELEGKTEVYDHIRHPNALIQAPVLKMIYTVNKGSLGLPRGKIQEAVSRYSGSN